MDAAYMASVSLEELGRVLRSDTATPMPMLEERHRALNEGGAVLLRHGGSLRGFLSCCRGDARGLVRHIVDNLPSYRDEAEYEVRSSPGTLLPLPSLLGSTLVGHSLARTVGTVLLLVSQRHLLVKLGSTVLPAICGFLQSW